MLIGVPKEIKNHEYRVGLTPTSVREAVYHGHKAVVESGAGAAIGLQDEDYAAAGAEIVPSARAKTSASHSPSVGRQFQGSLHQLSASAFQRSRRWYIPQ